MNKHKNFICKICSNKFNDFICKKRKFCSHKCYWKSLKEIRGNNHFNWVQGKSKHFCYICSKKFFAYKSAKRKMCGMSCSGIFRKKFRDKIHHNWKGDKVGYRTIHWWLKNRFGKAAKCEQDNCQKKSRNYQWALLKKKQYQRKRENFWQLCASCHTKYDRNRKLKR